MSLLIDPYPRYPFTKIPQVTESDIFFPPTHHSDPFPLWPTEHRVPATGVVGSVLHCPLKAVS